MSDTSERAPELSGMRERTGSEPRRGLEAHFKDLLKEDLDFETLKETLMYICRLQPRYGDGDRGLDTRQIGDELMTAVLDRLVAIGSGEPGLGDDINDIRAVEIISAVARGTDDPERLVMTFESLREIIRRSERELVAGDAFRGIDQGLAFSGGSFRNEESLGQDLWLKVVQIYGECATEWVDKLRSSHVKQAVSKLKQLANSSDTVVKQEALSRLNSRLTMLESVIGQPGHRDVLHNLYSIADACGVEYLQPALPVYDLSFQFTWPVSELQARGVRVVGAYYLSSQSRYYEHSNLDGRALARGMLQFWASTSEDKAIRELAYDYLSRGRRKDE